MVVSELPELPAFTAESADRAGARHENQIRKEQSTSGLIVSGFIVLILGAVISGAFTLLGKSQLMEWLGASPIAAQSDKNAAAIQELQAQLERFSLTLSELKQEQATLVTHADANTNEMSMLTHRVSNIERFTSDLEQRIAENRKAQQIQLSEQKKKSVQTKPKQAAIVPVVLVSIRNQAGTPFVALRDGLDNSELLMPGDSWRGWTFLYADPTTKTARFKVAGSERELRL